MPAWAAITAAATPRRVMGPAEAAMTVAAEAASLGGSSACQQARSREKQLSNELESLREMYAKKIALTELKCEEALRGEEESRDKWYKKKKSEIKQMQATVAIMNALYKKKRRELLDQMKHHQAECDARTAELNEQVEQLKRDHAKELQRRKREFDDRIEDLQAQNRQLLHARDASEATAKQLEEDLNLARTQTSRLSVETERLRNDVTELTKKLNDPARAAELRSKKAMIEELEAELKKTKRIMQEQGTRETLKLRQELMEYTRFIVNNVPDCDWFFRQVEAFSTGQQQMATPDLDRPLSFPGSPGSPVPHRGFCTDRPMSSCSATPPSWRSRKGAFVSNSPSPTHRNRALTVGRRSPQPGPSWSRKVPSFG